MPRLLPLRVLCTTGHIRDAVVHNGVLDPGTHPLAKPFSVEQLSAKIAEVLDGGAAGSSAETPPQAP